MFLIPFEIPAAAGFLFLKSKLQAKLGRSRSAEVVIGLLAGIVLMAILNGTFRALFPLLTDAHNYPNPSEP
jgi:hypothetical protein